MGKIKKMPHYGYNLANKKWDKIIQDIWDKLNEIIAWINKQEE